MRCPIVRLALAGLAFLASGPIARGHPTFRFGFDDISASTNAIVGSGSATFAGDPGDGTFSLESLGSFAMSFAFNDGASFTEADIATPLSEVLVVLSTSGATRRLQFSNVGDFGSGPNSGSIDFEDAGGSLLSFAPPGTDSGLELYFESSHFGTYQATAVPEPPSVLLVALAAPLVAVIVRRYRRKLAA